MAKNTIKIKNYLNVFEELKAAGTIKPGMLVEVTSDGEVQAHSTQNGNALPKFAIENELAGEGITDDYAADDQVQVWTPSRGDLVYGLLADGQSVDIGDFLASNGDGYLKAFEGGSAADEDLPLEIVAMAREKIDRSSSSGGDTNVTGRIVVEIV